MADNTTLMHAINAIATQAGEEIMAVYRQAGALQVINKQDASPLTEADTRANTLICKALQALTPRLPIISEESALAPFSTRRQWQEYWLVDPLDGTREFINRNGEFTVNIALIRGGVPVLGVIHAPVTQNSWMGLAGYGAWKRVGEQALLPIRTRVLGDKLLHKRLRVLGSRHHGNTALQKLLARAAGQFGGLDLLPMGSSLKFCAIAEGSADLYVRFGPTCEWDTAAAQVILEAAGGRLLRTNFTLLTYNHKESLLNPPFIAFGDAGQDWPRILGSLQA